MMMQLVIFLEEASAKTLLQELLPPLLPQQVKLRWHGYSPCVKPVEKTMS